MKTMALFPSCQFAYVKLWIVWRGLAWLGFASTHRIVCGSMPVSWIIETFHSHTQTHRVSIWIEKTADWKKFKAAHAHARARKQSDKLCEICVVVILRLFTRWKASDAIVAGMQCEQLTFVFVFSGQHKKSAAAAAPVFSYIFRDIYYHYLQYFEPFAITQTTYCNFMQSSCRKICVYYLLTSSPSLRIQFYGSFWYFLVAHINIVNFLWHTLSTEFGLNDFGNGTNWFSLQIIRSISFSACEKSLFSIKINPY